MTKKEIKEFKKFLRSKGKLRRVRFLCGRREYMDPLEVRMKEESNAPLFVSTLPWNSSEGIDYWALLGAEWMELCFKNK